jgi:exopolyphosphatase/pppGpp-phosphohydrolase
MPAIARAGRPIETERATILPAGLACLGATLERVGAGDVRVTTRGLRHGVVRRILGLASD